MSEARTFGLPLLYESAREDFRLAPSVRRLRFWGGFSESSLSRLGAVTPMIGVGAACFSLSADD